MIYRMTMGPGFTTDIPGKDAERILQTRTTSVAQILLPDRAGKSGKQ
jgi:hypothetical protein